MINFVRKLIILVCTIAIAILSTNTFAMLPVVDASAVSNLIKNYNQLKKQYDVLNQTYSKTKNLVSDAEGHYGYGALLNSSKDLKNREWSPDNWENTLKGLSGGNPDRYQELVNSYKQSHSTLSTSDFKKGASADKAELYEQDIKVNQATSVNATYSFNDINTHLKTINDLSSKIDQAQNTKAAMDLNSRLLAEVAYIQTQELKMQVLMNQQVAQGNADTIAEQSQSAKFNTLPTE